MTTWLNAMEDRAAGYDNMLIMLDTAEAAAVDSMDAAIGAAGLPAVQNAVLTAKAACVAAIRAKRQAFWSEWSSAMLEDLSYYTGLDHTAIMAHETARPEHLQSLYNVQAKSIRQFFSQKDLTPELRRTCAAVILNYFAGSPIDPDTSRWFTEAVGFAIADGVDDRFQSAGEVLDFWARQQLDD